MIKLLIKKKSKHFNINLFISSKMTYFKIQPIPTDVYHILRTKNGFITWNEVHNKISFVNVKFYHGFDAYLFFASQI